MKSRQKRSSCITVGPAVTVKNVLSQWLLHPPESLGLQGELATDHDVVDFIMNQPNVVPRINARVLSTSRTYLDLSDTSQYTLVMSTNININNMKWIFLHFYSFVHFTQPFFTQMINSFKIASLLHITSIHSNIYLLVLIFHRYHHIIFDICYTSFCLLFSFSFCR